MSFTEDEIADRRFRDLLHSYFGEAPDAETHEQRDARFTRDACCHHWLLLFRWRANRTSHSWHDPEVLDEQEMGTGDWCAFRWEYLRRSILVSVSVYDFSWSAMDAAFDAEDDEDNAVNIGSAEEPDSFLLLWNWMHHDGVTIRELGSKMR